MDLDSTGENVGLRGGNGSIGGFSGGGMQVTAVGCSRSKKGGFSQQTESPRQEKNQTSKRLECMLWIAQKRQAEAKQICPTLVAASGSNYSIAYVIHFSVKAHLLSTYVSMSSQYIMLRAEEPSWQNLRRL